MNASSFAKRNWSSLERISGITAALVLLVVLLDLMFVPSLIVLSELVTGRGLDIDTLLRIHFIFLSWLLFLVVLTLLFVRPAGDPRARLILLVLGVEILVLLAIWVFDRSVRFEAERSAVTFFTSVVLILTSLAAFANTYGPRFVAQTDKLARAFWTLLGIAFLVAGFDEIFEGHERSARLLEPLGARFGISANIVQDLTTICYVVGAVIFVVLFGNYVRREMLRSGAVSGKIFIVAIATYALSVFNDSADAVFELIFPIADPRHFMNFLEEVLEFTAANLFFSSFCIALVERVGPKPDEPRIQRGIAVPRVTRVLTVILITVTLLGSAVLAVMFRSSAPGIIAAGHYELSVFADASDGLDGVDQLIFDPGLGLVVGNERSSTVLRLEPGSDALILIDSKTGLVSPDGIAIGDASLYVADDMGQRVLEYALDGRLVGSVGNGWVSPEGVAIDRDGVLYVADQALRMVVRMAPGNKQIVATALDGLIAPEQLAFDDSGNLYVTDEHARAVFRISPDGRVVPFVTAKQHGLECPESIVFHGEYLYVSDSCSVAVFRFGLDGAGGSFIRFTRKYRDLAGIAFDDKGMLYVAVGSNYRPHNLIMKISGIE